MTGFLSTPLAFARRHWALVAVLVAHAALWTLADCFISPHPDFIDHWVQSRVLSWGYYEHPPMVAWLIRALTGVFGSSEGALEGIAIGVNLTILAAVYGVAARNFGTRAAVFTLLCLEATLYFAGGTPMLQIEQPLLLSWIGALAALLEYRRSNRSAWLLAVGVFAGLGALSKYTMVLFYLGGLVYVLLVPARRVELRRPWLYAAGLLSLLIFSPVLAWNAQHDWFSFRFQLEKAAGPTEAFFGKHLIEFSMGYVILFSPVLAVGGVAPLWRRLRGHWQEDRPDTLLAVMALVPVGFFSLAMIRGSFPDPKWANVGFVSFFLLLGSELERWSASGPRRKALRLLGAALLLNAAMLAAFALHAWRPFLPLSETNDPAEQVVGWRKAGAEVDALLQKNGVREPSYVISFTYPLASQFALHLASHPLTHSLKRPQRNLWSRPQDMRPDATIVVCQARECLWVVGKVAQQFGWSLRSLGQVEVSQWGVPRHKVTVLVPVASPPPSAPRR